MSETYEPYITQYPGDAITAEDNNQMQIMIKEDIANQTQAAVEGIERVPNADNADKLEQKTLAEIAEEIVQRALAEIPKQTGYRKLFLKLKVGEEKKVEHKLKACPLVDLYQLDYFPVVASEDGFQYVTWVNFYLYQTREQKFRFKDESVDPAVLRIVEVERSDGAPYRIPFKDMLDYYKVEYTEDSSLGDLETEFWKAFFADPNDDFDDDQQAHSPWFDRCCRENTSVKEIKRKGNWDDIWFQMRPRKTVNYPYKPDTGEPEAPDRTTDPDNPEPMPALTQIEVVHFDFNTLGLKLLRNPVHPPEITAGITADKILPIEDHRDISEELKVMALLKV